MALVVVQIIILSPTSLEQDDVGGKVKKLLERKEILNNLAAPTIAPGIPRNQIPEYIINQFNYISTKAGQKQWNLIASQAYLYNQEKIVHSRAVTAYLFNPDGKYTLVTGKEAKYYMNEKDLEVFGRTRTSFPDGFTIESEYLKYFPDTRRIEIPANYRVRGEGNAENDGKRIHFQSGGLDYPMDENIVTLPTDVTFIMERVGPKGKSTKGVSDQTTIKSDHCVIERDIKLAHFTMQSERPLTERFVRITQPGIRVRSRLSDLHYGDSNDILNYLVAREDVLIQELPEKGNENIILQRYSTSGQADFDTNEDRIVLTQFPQVYENSDTVTGDVIVMHRDTDVIEVEQSNAYNTGRK